jgi:mRNA interferase YafQ
VAREIVVLPRFKRDYKRAKNHPEFDAETVEYVLDLLTRGRLPAAFNEHKLEKRRRNWAGFWECHLGGDLVMIYRETKTTTVMHRIGSHSEVFGVKLI